MKHTNLGDEIFTIKKPRTDWVSAAVTTVCIVGLGFCIYGVAMVLEALMVLN